jgi:two-component system, chemotaxis family, response regulator PixG
MSTDTNQLEQQLQLDLKATIVQLQKLKANSFTGELWIRSADSKFCLAFVFRLGRVIWASGNVDPYRHWARQLLKHQADLPQDWLRSIADEQKPGDSSRELAELMIEGSIDRRQLTEALTKVLGEVFFDLIQVSKMGSDQFTIETAVGEEFHEETTASESTRSSIVLPLIELDPVLKTAIQEWQEWQASCSTKFSPNLFPVIQQYEAINALAPNAPERQLLAKIDGTKTIRDIACQYDYPLVSFAKSLLYYLQSGLISLSKTPKQVQSFAQPATVPKRGITIACIDDSPLVYQSLKQILEAQGYDCYGVQEPLTIMPRLIKNKPDFIFLDLLMPIINGYEVCGQIRKTPSLKDIPVVILTGKDGLVDRMRSKMVGATDFISKPVSADTVVKIMNKYLSV